MNQIESSPEMSNPSWITHETHSGIPITCTYIRLYAYGPPENAIPLMILPIIARGYLRSDLPRFFLGAA